MLILEIFRARATTNEDDITSPWNANYVGCKLGGPVTKILLDNCYHMITVDLQYQRVIELSVDFIQQQTSDPARRTRRLPTAGVT